MSDNLAYDQRVVYAGLSRMTNDRNLIRSAFKHWESELSSDSLDVIEVVGKMVDFLGLEVTEKKALMIGMHAASNKLLDELEAVPPYISGGGELPAETSVPAKTAASEAAKVPAHVEVVQRYLQLCCQHVQRHSDTDFRDLMRAIQSEGLPGVSSKLSSAVKAWAAAGLQELSLPIGTQVDEAKDLAHEFYILLTEFIGPVEADVIVNKVVTATMSMDAAQRFSPRELL